MKIGTVVIYYPGNAVSKETFRTAWVTRCYEFPNMPHMLKLALIPEFTGDVEIVQTAYHVSDPRLKNPNGSQSEAALRNGSWETVGEHNARFFKKASKKEADGSEGQS